MTARNRPRTTPTTSDEDPCRLPLLLCGLALPVLLVQVSAPADDAICALWTEALGQATSDLDLAG